MKPSCIIITLAVVTIASSADYYEDPEVEIETLVSDGKVLQLFVNCFIDKGPCDEEQKKIKAIISEAIQQACNKCSVKHKLTAQAFLKTCKEKLPADYEVFRKKYDAENKYIPVFLAK